MKLRKKHSSPAFTIVELLVVIVVVGILAAISIVAYSGITGKATIASLSSDLSNASRQLKVFQTINGNYPATISINCSTTPDTTTNKCLTLSSGNTITSLVNDYSVNNSTRPQTFSLTIKNTSSNIISVITDSSKPAVLAPAPLNPVADWIATPIDNGVTGDHFGNFYDTVSKTYATVTRAGTKTIYDPATQHIYDVPANKLAINPRSDGKNGFEAVVEEGRTNYLTNSDGEDVLGYPSWYNNNWGGSSATVTQDSSSMVHGSNSVKFTTTNWVDNSFSLITYINSATYTIPMTNGTTYTYSIWGRVLSGSASYQLDFQESNGTSSQVITLNSSWQRFSVTRTLGAGVANIILRVYALNGNQSSLWDAAQIETGSYPSSYIPTNATVASRNGDLVTIPTTNWNNTQGTFFCVAQTDPATLGPVGNYLLQWYDSGSSRLGFHYTNTYQSYLGYYDGSGGPYVYKNRALAKEYITQTASWAQGGTWASYVNGGTVQSWSQAGSFSLTNPIAYLGNDRSGGERTI